jgi:hypothetical protein
MANRRGEFPAQCLYFEETLDPFEKGVNKNDNKSSNSQNKLLGRSSPQKTARGQNGACQKAKATPMRGRCLAISPSVKICFNTHTGALKGILSLWLFVNLAWRGSGIESKGSLETKWCAVGGQGRKRPEVC